MLSSCYLYSSRCVQVKEQEIATVITIISQKTAYTKLAGSGGMRTKSFQVSSKALRSLQNLLSTFVPKTVGLVFFHLLDMLLFSLLLKQQCP